MGKIYDGMIGVAVGDALGVPVEFVSREELAKAPITEMTGYGTHDQPRGTWSDDTSLTLALMDSLACRQAVDYRDIMDKFSQWLLYGAYTATGEICQKIIKIDNNCNESVASLLNARTWDGILIQNVKETRIMDKRKNG